MAEGNDTKQKATVGIQIYKVYLEDLGRIGGRHDNIRKFYMSVMSALFVFLSLGGKNGIFVSVQGAILGIVGVVGIVICIAWFEHMRSYGKLYLAKLSTLRHLEEDLENDRPLKPFMFETEQLKPVEDDEKSTQNKSIKWGYTPLTLVDRIVPAASVLLFVGLLVFKFLY